MNCRALVAVVLLALLSLEILPCSYQEDPTTAGGASARFACHFEPLQVCDHGDSFLGVLADLPVLVPGALVIFADTGISTLLPERTRFVPEGFTPPIEHPPELSA